MASRRVISKGKRRTKSITKGKGKKRMTTRRNRQNKKYGGEPDTNTYRGTKRTRGSMDSEQTYEPSLEDVVKRIRDEKRIIREKEEAEIAFFEECFRGKRRRTPSLLIPVRDIKPPKHSYRGQTMVSPEEMEEFVNKQIDRGVQLVTFAVDDYNHAILVDVQEDKIMISDWKGNPEDPTNENSDFDTPNYDNYRDLLNSLRKKYQLEIQFYDINPLLKKEAIAVNKSKGNAGGCSHYIYEWISIYYKNFHIIDGKKQYYYEDPCS